MRVRKSVVLASLFALALFALPSWAGEEKVRIGVFQFESKASGVSQQQANEEGEERRGEERRGIVFFVFMST